MCYLSYEDFLEQVKKLLRERMGEAVKVCLYQVPKNNAVILDGLTLIREDQKVSPIVYLNGFYQDYLDGKPLEDVIAQIMDICLETRIPEHIDVSFYMEYESASKRIVCRLVNYEKNQTLLKEIPHQKFLDMAVVYYYLLEDQEIGMASILVRNEHLNMWQVDKEMLHETAVENTRKLLPSDFMSMDEMMQSIMDPDGYKELEERDQLLSPIYILTNKERNHGAFWLTDGKVLEQIGVQLGCDYYVLPSSIHECLVVPVQEGIDERTLQRIVCEVNVSVVEPEDILGDTVYRYDRQEKKLREAAGKEYVM